MERNFATLLRIRIEKKRSDPFAFSVFQLADSHTWKRAPWTSWFARFDRSLQNESVRGESRVFSSVAPSSLALPPEMAFQRETGGMPVHITVHRGQAKQLAHLHAAAVHTRRARFFLSRWGSLSFTFPPSSISSPILINVSSDPIESVCSERLRNPYASITNFGIELYRKIKIENVDFKFISHRQVEPSWMECRSICISSLDWSKKRFLG